MTLVELLIGMVVLGILMSGVSFVFIATMKQQGSSRDRIENTGAQQRVQTWVLADLQSATVAGVDTAPGTANPCPNGTAGTNVLLASWDDLAAGTTYKANYRLEGTTFTRNLCRVNPAGSADPITNIDALVLATNVTSASASVAAPKVALSVTTATGNESRTFSITGLLRAPTTTIQIDSVTTAPAPPTVPVPPCSYDEKRGADDPDMPSGYTLRATPNKDAVLVNAKGILVDESDVTTEVAVSFLYDFHGVCPDYNPFADPTSPDYDPDATDDNVKGLFFRDSDRTTVLGAAAFGDDLDLGEDQPMMRQATFPAGTAIFWPVNSELQVWNFEPSPYQQLGNVDTPTTPKADDFNLDKRELNCKVKDNGADTMGFVGATSVTPDKIYLGADGTLRKDSAIGAPLTSLRVRVELDGAAKCSPYDAANPAANLVAKICVSGTLSLTEPFTEPAGAFRSATFDLASKYASVIWAKVQYNAEARDDGPYFAFMGQPHTNEHAWNFPPGCTDPRATQVDKDLGVSIGLRKNDTTADSASFKPK